MCQVSSAHTKHNIDMSNVRVELMDPNYMLSRFPIWCVIQCQEQTCLVSVDGCYSTSSAIRYRWDKRYFTNKVTNLATMVGSSIGDNESVACVSGPHCLIGSQVTSGLCGDSLSTPSHHMTLEFRSKKGPSLRLFSNRLTMNKPLLSSRSIVWIYISFVVLPCNFTQSLTLGSLSIASSNTELSYFWIEFTLI